MAALLVVSGASAACRLTGEPSARRVQWVADITARGQVLFMSIDTTQGIVGGTGSVGSLTGTGGDPLTIAGLRAADSLHLTFAKDAVPSFTFSGAFTYVGPNRTLVGIGGRLNGGGYTNTSVAFRRP